MRPLCVLSPVASLISGLSTRRLMGRGEVHRHGSLQHVDHLFYTYSCCMPLQQTIDGRQVQGLKTGNRFDGEHHPEVVREAETTISHARNTPARAIIRDITIVAFRSRVSNSSEPSPAYPRPLLPVDHAPGLFSEGIFRSVLLCVHTTREMECSYRNFV